MRHTSRIATLKLVASIMLVVTLISSVPCRLVDGQRLYAVGAQTEIETAPETQTNQSPNSDVTTSEESPNEPAADKSSARYTAEALRELKQSGWQRSRYHTTAVKPAVGSEAHQPAQPKLQEYRDVIGPILKQACHECHGSSQSEGNIRIDTLDPNLHSGKDVDWWNEIFAVLSKGEMPPRESPQLTDDQRAKIVEWLS